MSKCIGVDIGYGYTKSFTSGQPGIFPTAVSSIIPQSTFGEIKFVSVNEENFLVGADAEREGLGLIETRTSRFVKSNPWLAILGQVFVEANFVPDYSVLVLGIPPVLFSKSLEEEISDCIKNSRMVANGNFAFNFRNSTIKVIPQGAGIFFSHLQENPGSFSKNVAILDIGHFTVDMVFFSHGRYVESVEETIPTGTSLLLDNIGKAFYRKFGFAIRYPEIKKLLKDKALNILGSTYHLPEVRDIAASYCNQVSSLVSKYIQKLPASPDIGIAGGGGIVLLSDLVKLGAEIQVVKFPEMANAYGNWLYGSKTM